MTPEYIQYPANDWRFQQFQKINKTKGPATFNRTSLRAAAQREFAQQNAMMMGTDIHQSLGRARTAFKGSKLMPKVKAVGGVAMRGLGLYTIGSEALEGYQDNAGLGAAAGVGSGYLGVHGFSIAQSMFGARAGGMAAMRTVLGAGLAKPGVAIAAGAMALNYVAKTGRDARRKMQFGEELIDSPMISQMRGQAFSGMRNARHRISASMQHTAHMRDRIVDALGDEASYLHL